MIIQENKVTIDNSILSEFCKVVERSLSDSKFIYFLFEDNQFLLYSEGTYGYCFYKEFIESDSKFCVGIEASKFFSMVKRLYSGDIHLTIEKNFVKLNKDNIEAKFPVTAGRTRQNFLDNYMYVDDKAEVAFITNSLIDSHIVEENKNFTKFNGVLFETKGDATRICKFSGLSIYISSFKDIRDPFIPGFDEDFRTTFPEMIVKAAKQFNKEISAYVISEDIIGIVLKNGTTLYGLRTVDAYPMGYLKYFGLTEEGKIDSDKYYEFSKESLINSIDLVSCALGDSETWVNLSIFGTSGENLVWKISGKNNTGLEIKENIISSKNEISDSFSINGKRTVSGLTVFDKVVRLYNVNSSNILFSNEDNSKILILTKANV